MAYTITEGVSGMHHYHFSIAGSETRGLCGARTMRTSIPIDAWRVPFGEHFPKRPTWCSACEVVRETAQPAGKEGGQG